MLSIKDVITGKKKYHQEVVELFSRENWLADFFSKDYLSNNFKEDNPDIFYLRLLNPEKRGFLVDNLRYVNSLDKEIADRIKKETKNNKSSKGERRALVNEIRTFCYIDKKLQWTVEWKPPVNGSGTGKRNPDLKISGDDCGDILLEIRNIEEKERGGSSGWNSDDTVRVKGKIIEKLDKFQFSSNGYICGYLFYVEDFMVDRIDCDWAIFGQEGKRVDLNTRKVDGFRHSNGVLHHKNREAVNNLLKSVDFIIFSFIDQTPKEMPLIILNENAEINKGKLENIFLNKDKSAVCG